MKKRSQTEFTACKLLAKAVELRASQFDQLGMIERILDCGLEGIDECIDAATSEPKADTYNGRLDMAEAILIKGGIIEP